MNTHFYSSNSVVKVPIVFHLVVWRRHEEINVYIVENIGYPICHCKLKQNVGYQVVLNEKYIHIYMHFCTSVVYEYLKVTFTP